MHEHERPVGHERYDELCALAVSGTLTDADWAELKDHLRICEECRDAHMDYRVLTKDGMPMLAVRYGRQQEQRNWDDSAVRQKLFAKIGAEEHQASVKRGIHWRIAIHPMVRIAAAACLIAAVGIAAYRSGRRAGAAEKHIQPRVVVAFQKPATESKARDARDGVLNAQTRALALLKADSSRKQQQIERLQAELHILEDRSNEYAAAKATSDEQLHAMAQQRDVLAGQLREALQSYEGAQIELARLRTERDNTTLSVTSLQNQVEQLLVANRDQEQKLRTQQQYLASDRDIRELMGARQLYIADVFDVSSDSRTRKPYGRVFYTKGKSLIFYAYDLDRQPGVKNAHTFQAWGQKEAESRRPLNLGILYMDNEANRRWVLRVDEPKQLAEIDSIFVTVEPQGGSYEPTGKRFLYASLRKEVNHP